MQSSAFWRIVGIVAFAIVVYISDSTRADQQGVLGKKLILNDDTVSGEKSLTLLLTGETIHKGADGDAALLSGSVGISYWNLATWGTIQMPSPWNTNARGTAKLLNSQAVPGNDPVKSAIFTNGKKGKVLAVDIGGIDLSNPPDAGGVLVRVTIHNGNDNSTQQMCTRFVGSEGSTIRHTNSNGKRSLTLTKGIPADCQEPCGTQQFTLTTGSYTIREGNPFTGYTYYNYWDGEGGTFCSSPSCCVGIGAPHGLSNSTGCNNPFSITYFTGFSQCSPTDDCTATCNYGQGGCLFCGGSIPTDPYCPSHYDFLSGYQAGGTASFTVQCVP